MRWAHRGQHAVEAGQHRRCSAIDRDDHVHVPAPARDGGWRDGRGDVGWERRRREGDSRGPAGQTDARWRLGQTNARGRVGQTDGRRRVGQFGVRRWAGQIVRQRGRGRRGSSLPGIRVKRTAQHVVAVTPQHVQRPAEPGQGCGGDGKAARACQRDSVLDRSRQVRGGDPQRVTADTAADQQDRIGVRIAGVPGPSAEAAVLRLDETGDPADRGEPDRASEQVVAAHGDREFRSAGPGAWQARSGASLAIQPDLGLARHCRSDDEPAVGDHAAPTDGGGAADDGVGKRCRPRHQCRLRHMPRQRLGQGAGRAGGVALLQPRRGQAEPGRAHILGLGNRPEQRFGARIVAAQARGGERQREGAVMRCQAVGAIQPAYRGGAVARHERLLAALQRLACESDAVVGGSLVPRAHGLQGHRWSGQGEAESCGSHQSFAHQRPTACGSGAVVAGGGKPARSPRASWRPWPTARSSQWRARSMLRSPARPRVR